MSYSKLFFYTCFSFLIGVFVNSVFAIDFFWAFLVFLAGILFVFLALINRYYLFIGLCLIFGFFGILRYQATILQDDLHKIHYYNNQHLEFEGIISQEPDQRQDRVKYTIKAEKVKTNDSWLPVSGQVLVTSYLFPEYNYGDRVKVVCDLQQPEQIEDFAYDKYLARYNIYSLCYYPKIIVLDSEQGNMFLGNIFKFKSYFTTKLNKILPEPQASFLGGLLIGARKAIPPDLTQAFSQTGTTHIIAVSGYNVTIIATFLLLFTQNLGLGRKKAFWLIILFLVIFDIITGLPASIIRASIMGGLVLLANYLGRLSSMKNALVFTAAIMILINPQILVYDLGFQLSFLATLGLIYLNPIIIRLFRIKQVKSKLVQTIVGDYFLTTMSAIILTTPLILYNFGKISLIAPLANILVLPFIPIAMLLGFISGVLSIIFTPLGWVAGWSVWLVLTYIIWVLQSLAKLDWAYFEFPKISLWLMLGLYLVIVGFIYKFKARI
ncbi:ComEC/Rec2 family competence protein [Patescibacteria group bacterium]